MTGPLTGLWRYRIGDWRVVVDICDDRLVILALDIEHRSRGVPVTVLGFRARLSCSFSSAPRRTTDDHHLEPGLKRGLTKEPGGRTRVSPDSVSACWGPSVCLNTARARRWAPAGERTK
ncbi:MAG: hypothetical protein IPH03_09045 [Tetrasphaera sp.]|nr:hypothetical protein [Tetrasphaera sp.]